MTDFPIPKLFYTQSLKYMPFLGRSSMYRPLKEVLPQWMLVVKAKLIQRRLFEGGIIIFKYCSVNMTLKQAFKVVQIWFPDQFSVSISLASELDLPINFVGSDCRRRR